VADDTDLNDLFRLCEEFWLQAPRYQGRSWDAERMEPIIEAVTKHGGCGVLEVGHSLVGVLLGFLDEDWATGDKYVTELVVYIVEEYRTFPLFKDLVRGMEAYGKKHGHLEARVAVRSGYAPEKLIRAYELLGYEDLGFREASKRL
jgi:hypothetical protein